MISHAYQIRHVHYSSPASPEESGDANQVGWLEGFTMAQEQKSCKYAQIILAFCRDAKIHVSGMCYMGGNLLTLHFV